MQIGFPETKRVRMRYTDYIHLQSTLGVIAAYDYYTNGLYDPQVAIGGHQPMGYDQIVGVYYNYAYVVGSKITVKFLPEFAPATDPIIDQPVMVGVYPYDSGINASLIYTDWQSYSEAGFPCKTISSIQPKVVATGNFSARKCIGLVDRNSPASFNTTTSNPGIANMWVYHIWLQTLDQSGLYTSNVFAAEVTIDYIVEFSNRIPLPPS